MPNLLYLFKSPKGLSISDVKTLYSVDQVICDNNTEDFVLKSVTIGGGLSKF